MGCVQTRQYEKSTMITCEIKYLIPELVQAIKLAQQCLYSPESPITLTPIKPINGIYCKIESTLPSGSVKMRAIYNMLYRLQQKKRYRGDDELNLVISSSGNAATACIESLKLLKSDRKLNQKQEGIASEFVYDDTPTDPGLSVEIKDEQFQSKIKPYELIGKLIIFSKYVKEIHQTNDLPNVTIIHSELNKNEIEKEAITYSQEMGYDYLDLQNDFDVFGGYATIGFEIDQWQVLTNTNIDYIFVTLKSGALIAGIAFYLKYIAQNQTRIIGVMLNGTTRKDATLCQQIIEGFIDEILYVTVEEVERAQCELAKAEQIAEFNCAIAYAGCKKSQMKNSLVVLSGGNVAVKDLERLMKKYE
ncbi:unnamed protein product [Paramecium primaurelia]|uniref:Tryptophan synthase beta chain-like PALP domain-containing protein n=1 Tax=Paramecium primaurelia TaxID=5886 RepID=A0A8S1MMM2_PARPR|nr:unnamed protein product [Paramecium primaurelia]